MGSTVYDCTPAGDCCPTSIEELGVFLGKAAGREFGFPAEPAVISRPRNNINTDWKRMAFGLTQRGDAVRVISATESTSTVRPIQIRGSAWVRTLAINRSCTDRIRVFCGFPHKLDQGLSQPSGSLVSKGHRIYRIEA